MICASTRYSIEAVVTDTGIEAAMLNFDSNWISQLWAPTALKFDQAFANEPFLKYLELHRIEPRPIQARRNKKNALESKHKIIPDVFLCLISDNSELASLF